MNIHRRRKAFELLPLKGKNCLSSSPQNIIQLHFFFFFEEVFTMSNTIHISKIIIENKKNKSASDLNKVKRDKEPIELIKDKLSEKQKQFLIKILTENELLYPEMDKEIVNLILETIIYKKVKNNMKLFTQDKKEEDNYYIIEKGKLQYSIDDELYELPKGNGIGTQALLQNCQFNCFIRALGKTYIYVLPLDKYKNIADDYEKKRNIEIIKYLHNSYFFSNLDYETLEKIAKISSFLDCEDKTLILEKNKLYDINFLILKLILLFFYIIIIIKFIYLLYLFF